MRLLSKRASLAEEGLKVAFPPALHLHPSKANRKFSPVIIYLLADIFFNLYLVLKLALFFLVALLSLAFYRISGARVRLYDFRQRPQGPASNFSQSTVARVPGFVSLVQAHEFYSSSLKRPVTYSIFIPPAYATSLERNFPVIYWLHGSNGSGRSLEPLAQKFLNAMRSGLMEESIIVFPESERLSMWVNSKDNSYPSEDIVINDLIPHIQQSYRISQNRSQTFIAGFSMGGYGAARIGLKFRDLFGHIIMVGAGTLDDSLDHTPRANQQIKLSVLNDVYGGSDAYFYEQSPRFEALTNKQKSPDYPISITIIVGEEDEVYSQNLNFSEFLRQHGYDNLFLSLPGISHNLRDYLFLSQDALFHNVW